MEKYMLYYVGGAMLIYIVFWKIIPFIKKAKKVTKVLLGRVYLNKNSNVSQEEYKKIAIGALYSEQQTAYINSITTGLGTSDIKKMLSEWWGINNSEEAKEKLQYLANKGFRFYFQAVYKAYQLADKEEQKAVITSSFSQNNEEDEEDVLKAYEQLFNLQGTWDELSRNNVITTHAELEKYNNIGWDCGRLVFLSRLCFDAKYISENETWKYIDKAYELAINNFNTWEEFSKSYIIGRAMWGGTECANEGIIEIAKELLKDEKSPWIQLSFK